MESLPWRDICTSICIAALLTIAQIWKQIKCSSIKKIVCVCVYMRSGKMKVLVDQLCPTYSCHSMDCRPPVSCLWNSPGKNTGVGCHSLLQRIFLTQVSNLGLLHCRQILYELSHQGNIYIYLIIYIYMYLIIIIYILNYIYIYILWNII